MRFLILTIFSSFFVFSLLVIFLSIGRWVIRFIDNKAIVYL